jgi:orotate phosphoribosyltransferase
MIHAAGATPAGVLIALDRQEVGALAGSTRSAAQEFAQSTGIPVVAVATLEDIIKYLQQQPGETDKLEKIEAYRQQYGANL